MSFESNKILAIAIIRLNNMRNEPACVQVLEVLDLLVAEAREDNDEAGMDKFQKNQGMIAAYKILKEYIVRGLPGK